MLGIYFILGLVMLTLPSIALVSDRDTMTKITVWWFTFGIAIAIIEFCMFFNQEYMASNRCPINSEVTWYTRDYNLSKAFDSKIWADAWKEYCKRSGDFRYLETMKGDFVPWIEFINGIIALIFGVYVIYGITSNNISKLNIAVAILTISATQIFGTTLYFSSYYTKCIDKVNSFDALWWIHLVFMNILWIVFPVLVSKYAYELIQ